MQEENFVVVYICCIGGVCFCWVECVFGSIVDFGSDVYIQVFCVGLYVLIYIVIGYYCIYLVLTG